MRNEHMRLDTLPKLLSLKPYEAAIDEAKTFLRGSDSSHRLTKELLYSGLTKNVADHQIASRDALLECFRSEAHKEGVASFTEKQKPNTREK
ncbi:MAG: hypothetical protein CM15mP49_32280 [Actinomycetota bacterium]|nr:MAG: hypothetical protein CM15mP49_32280 [Actinomycetota bacterium]